MLKKKIGKKTLSSLLDISDPFLLLDNCTKIKSGKKAIGIKKINLKNWFFKCHFLNEPVMPGTLQIEAMLQTVVLIIYTNEKLNKDKCLITKSNSNFYSKINKAGELKIIAEIINNKRGFIEAKAYAYFNKKKIGDGSFKFIKSNQLNIKS